VKFGEHFLGIYAFDEMGGNQLDRGQWMLVNETELTKENLESRNYTYVSENYAIRLNRYLVDYYENYMHRDNLKLITADYALYWFTYNSECDVILAEYAWNHSRPLHTALVRGAATVHNKEWGAMFTWTYNGIPYIESADELYNDMILAYSNGAKYLIIFNRPKISEYGILTDKHFDAIKRFWQYAKSNPQKETTPKQRIAYVLPKDYGWGFRNPDDKIWGIWGPDELSKRIWNETNRLINKYGSNVDIVYYDQKYWANIQLQYGQLVFWNESTG
jgi:hypothetical protein